MPQTHQQTYTEVTVVQEGSNYEIGDKLTISGASLGGSTPANDITVRVQSVSSFGGVVSNTHEGTAVGGTGLSVLQFSNNFRSNKSSNTFKSNNFIFSIGNYAELTLQLHMD